MKRAFLAFGMLAFSSLASATMLTLVPIFEPLSLHGTDSGEVISETGEALLATVMSTPMALTGSFPESLVDAIARPHKIPSNDPHYKTEEANLLVLCKVKLKAELSEGGGGLKVSLDISELTIPAAVDLTSRQVLKLAIVSIRKTLEEYQKIQTGALTVSISIDGAVGQKEALRDLSARIVLPPGE